MKIREFLKLNKDKGGGGLGGEGGGYEVEDVSYLHLHLLRG